MTRSAHSVGTVALLLIPFLIAGCGDSGVERLAGIAGPSAIGAAAQMGEGEAPGTTAGTRDLPAPVGGTMPQAVVWVPGEASPNRTTSAGATTNAAVVFDGRSSRPASAGVNPLALALAGPPALDQPSVDTERREVTIVWHRGFGDDPVQWVLSYTAPGGQSGSFTFAPGQTSVSANLPLAGSYTVTICAYNGPSDCPASQTRTFQLTATSGVPGALTGVSGSASGSRLTVSWGAPVTGGPPVTYVVLYAGQEFVVGLVNSASADVSPGRYLLVAFARNLSGDGPSTTVEVTVGGQTTAGNYTGGYSGTGSYFRSSNGCTWTPTYSGAITVILTQGSSGLVGSIRVTGTENVPLGSTSTPNFTCLSSESTYEDNQPVIISGTNIARTGLSVEASTGTFNGNLSGDTIVGTLSLDYTRGTGSISMPVTLTRTPD